MVEEEGGAWDGSSLCIKVYADQVCESCTHAHALHFEAHSCSFVNSFEFIAAVS